VSGTGSESCAVVGMSVCINGVKPSAAGTRELICECLCAELFKEYLSSEVIRKEEILKL
jgi:hypothetical protein